ncbi:hypothetical protein [Paraburkholderia pallida]
MPSVSLAGALFLIRRRCDVSTHR